MITLLRPFKKLFRVTADKKNCIKDIIEAMMILCLYIISDKPKYLHTEIQIVLDACNMYVNFKDIFKKASTLKLLCYKHSALSS